MAGISRIRTFMIVYLSLNWDSTLDVLCPGTHRTLFNRTQFRKSLLSLEDSGTGRNPSSLFHTTLSPQFGFYSVFNKRGVWNKDSARAEVQNSLLPIVKGSFCFLPGLDIYFGIGYKDQSAVLPNRSFFFFGWLISPDRHCMHTYTYTGAL